MRPAVLRRRRRRLAEQGCVHVGVIGDFDGSRDLDAMLAEGYRVEASGWKGRQGTAIDSDPATRAFYSAVAAWAAERGWLRLAYLRLDDRAIAFELLLQDTFAAYSVKTGYDEAHRTASPSTLLTHHTLEAVVASAAQTFEWLGHDEPYKMAFSDGVRERLSITWFAPTILGRLDHLLMSVLHPIALRAWQAIRERLPETTFGRLQTIRQRSGAARRDDAAMDEAEILARHRADAGACGAEQGP